MESQLIQKVYTRTEQIVLNNIPTKYQKETIKKIRNIFNKIYNLPFNPAVPTQENSKKTYDSAKIYTQIEKTVSEEINKDTPEGSAFYQQIKKIFVNPEGEEYDPREIFPKKRTMKKAVKIKWT